MAIKLNKKNPVIKDLYSKKFKPKVVKPKKREGQFQKKEKKVNLKPRTDLLYYFR